MRIPAALLALALVAACDADAATYTLYRSESVGDSARIHVATFDAEETSEYNRDGCETVRELFQVQPTNRARFWCEKGEYERKRAAR
jgi:hypothetical protein